MRETASDDESIVLLPATIYISKCFYVPFLRLTVVGPFGGSAGIREGRVEGLVDQADPLISFSFCFVPFVHMLVLVCGFR